MDRLKFEDCQNCKDWTGCVNYCLNNCGKPLDAWEEFNAYKELEEQGKLLKLPCLIGDKVYTIHNVKRKGVISKEIWENTVTSFNVERDGDWNISFEHIEPNGLICPNYCKFEHIGNLVFLTKPAAEQALKMKRKQ